MLVTDLTVGGAAAIYHLQSVLAHVGMSGSCMHGVMLRIRLRTELSLCCSLHIMSAACLLVQVPVTLVS
jgi:hypothetical protein